MYGSGCWATRLEANQVGVACCTSGLLDFIYFCTMIIVIVFVVVSVIIMQQLQHLYAYTIKIVWVCEHSPYLV